MKELSVEHEKALGEVESAQITNLQAEVTTLENQLTDKNKTIKMQQQRLSDLKKTLQREFKVQALPNDDPNHLLPPAGVVPGVAHPVSPTGKLSKSSSTPQGLNTLPDNYIHKPVFRNSMGVTSSSSSSGTPSSAAAAAAQLAQRQMDVLQLVKNGGDNPMIPTAGSTVRDLRSGGVNHGLEYNRDINFEYLRHVVLKFMLSRETEVSVIQLFIKGCCVGEV